MHFPKIAKLKTLEQVRTRLQELGIELPGVSPGWECEVSEAVSSTTLWSRWEQGGWKIGNRWCIHPMEGWDGAGQGFPSDLTERRWMRFGASGAKLIWGCEAAAVRGDGRANPRQLMAVPETTLALAKLRSKLVESHRERMGQVDDLCIGLQLTHSGRYAKPHGDQMEPRIAYHHPLLDSRVGIDPKDDRPIWTDGELEGLVHDYVVAAGVAEKAGFDFVDVKVCHGYLLHELLTAHTRPGRYGGTWEGRTNLLRQILAAIRAEYPGLKLGVRYSLFDDRPYSRGPDQVGRIEPWEGSYPFSVGEVLGPPFSASLMESLRLMDELHRLGVGLVNLTAGSPYYNPHLQRPAAYPPSDGYLPPEDPLVGVARQLWAVRQVKREGGAATWGGMGIVGSGYTYLQEWLPLVGQGSVVHGWTDFVGMGRMALSYPDLAADVLDRLALKWKRLCRTFSDCTTAPRHGMVSGCYPLDPLYRAFEEAGQVKKIRAKNE